MPQSRQPTASPRASNSHAHERCLSQSSTASWRSNGLRFVDLFCGLGGFRLAAEYAARRAGLTPQCVFSSDIDDACRTAYAANFGEAPTGDITKVAANDVPDHDLLLAGFPCQPFSIIGKMRGFEDTRGTLFFDIARILEAKRPAAFVLENVKLLAGHNGGRTLRRILETLRDLGYTTDYRILNALHFGLPQKRERIWIVGHRVNGGLMHWPTGGIPMVPLSQLLESNPSKDFYVSARIRAKRRAEHSPTVRPSIWHENKAGHISSYPYSCALRAGASYNYLLVDGERRLTPREMLRLQGFPESYVIACNNSQTRKQAGNSLPVNVALAVVSGLLAGLNTNAGSDTQPPSSPFQLSLMEAKGKYHAHHKPKAKNR
jgi:DNA (cytosine-5)-methyltransferase 1